MERLYAATCDCVKSLPLVSTPAFFNILLAPDCPDRSICLSCSGLASAAFCAIDKSNIDFSVSSSAARVPSNLNVAFFSIASKEGNIVFIIGIAKRASAAVRAAILFVKKGSTVCAIAPNPDLSLFSKSSKAVANCASAKACGSIISVILPNFSSACPATSLNTA